MGLSHDFPFSVAHPLSIVLIAWALLAVKVSSRRDRSAVHRFETPDVSKYGSMKARAATACTVKNHKILRNLLRSGTNSGHFLGHYVVYPCVFIHIPGGSFIFEIFLGQRRVRSDFLSIQGSPQLARVVAFRARHDGCLTLSARTSGVQYTDTTSLRQVQSRVLCNVESKRCRRGKEVDGCL